MPHPMTQELLTLLTRKDNIDSAFEQWRQRCVETLDKLPAEQRPALYDELQTVLQENRLVLEQESLDIYDDLNKITAPQKQKAAKAKQYQDNNNL